LWDLPADKQRGEEAQTLQVARCTKIIQPQSDTEETKYLITIKQMAKFVVGLGQRVAPTDIEEGMRVGYQQRLIEASIVQNTKFRFPSLLASIQQSQ
jgi:26S proteasome regulatory subunit T1